MNKIKKSFHRKLFLVLKSGLDGAVGVKQGEVT